MYKSAIKMTNAYFDPYYGKIKGQRIEIKCKVMLVMARCKSSVVDIGSVDAQITCVQIGFSYLLVFRKNIYIVYCGFCSKVDIIVVGHVGFSTVLLTITYSVVGRRFTRFTFFFSLFLLFFSFF